MPLNGDVLRFDGFTGAFLGVFVPEGSGGLHNPRTVAFGPDCSLYVAGEFKNGPDAVFRYQGRTGDFVDVFVPPGSGGLTGIADMVFGADGNLYVGNRSSGGSGHGDVLRYDGRTGAFLGTFVPNGTGGLLSAINLAFGPDGNLYVSPRLDEPPRIYKFDGATGAFLDVLGQDLDVDSGSATSARLPSGRT